MQRSSLAAHQASLRQPPSGDVKGTDTLVGTPGSGVLVVSPGPPSLATAGTGDVLTGVIAAFLAKGLEASFAAAAGAAAQQLAATLAPHQVGLVASDVIAHLPEALDSSL